MKLFNFSYIWKIIRTIVLVVGGLLSFFAIVELIRIYTILRDAHPVLGYSYLAVIILGSLWLILYLVVTIGKRPRVLIPPQIEDLAQASPRSINQYIAYLIKYMRRLVNNPLIEDDERTNLISHIEEIEKTNISGNFDIDTITEIEETVIEPALRSLDNKAEVKVRNCVRDIMLGVTLSPYRAVDLLIVIYRNLMMVVHVTSIYNSRPQLREQMSIFRDILGVIAAVNYLNIGTKFTEQLLAKVPFIGGVIDDFAQGAGAGILTSAAGHGAIFRCRAFRGWNKEEAINNLAGHLQGFMIDIKNMFIKDILPQTRPRVRSAASAEDRDRAGFWENVTGGISSSFDATTEVVTGFIKVPATVGKGMGRGMVLSGSTLGKIFSYGWSVTKKTADSTQQIAVTASKATYQATEEKREAIATGVKKGSEATGRFIKKIVLKTKSRKK